MEFLPNNELFLKTATFLKKQLVYKGYDWNVSKMKPMDGELYANAKVEVGGTVELLTGASTEVRGVTNFNGNKLVKNRIFVTDAIAFGYAIDDETKAEHEVEYVYNKIPAYLRHANIVLKQKDERVISMPIGSIINGRENGSQYRQLGALALIEDDSLVNLEIEFPQGVKAEIPEGKKLFVSFYMKGIETYIKR